MTTSIYMVINMPFAERLATLRKDRQLTQEALGEQVGLTKARFTVMRREHLNPLSMSSKN